MEEHSNYFNFLNTLTYFSREEFVESSKYFRKASLKKGDFMLKARKVCKDIAFIEKGLLKTYSLSSLGQEVISCFCSQNRLTTSLESFISQAPSKLEIQAIMHTDLILISHDDLHHLYQTVPAWLTVSRLLMEKEYLALSKYANSLNSETAKEKYLRLIEEQPLVLQNAAVQDIASYLGVSRETLSRIRNQVMKSIL
jgi:CRP-like cAMP-binding protein